MPGMKPKEGVNGEEMETEWRPNIYVKYFKEAWCQRTPQERIRKQCHMWKNPIRTFQEQCHAFPDITPPANIQCRVLMLDFRKTRFKVQILNFRSKQVWGRQDVWGQNLPGQPVLWHWRAVSQHLISGNQVLCFYCPVSGTTTGTWTFLVNLTKKDSW